jgi:hypothetical protein
MESLVLAAIDYTTLTTGLTSKFEEGVTAVLPVIALIIGAILVIRTIRRFAK